MSTRCIVVCTLAALSANAATAQSPTPPTRISPDERIRLADPSVGEWLSVAASEQETDDALALIDEAVRAAASSIDWEGRSVAPALDDLSVVLAAWCHDDADLMAEYRAEQGLVLDPEITRSSIANAVEWTFLDEQWVKEFDARSDQERQRALLDAQVRSGMRLDAVDVSSVEVGLGVNAVMNSTEWPHSGMEFSRSGFRCSIGFIEDPESLEDTPDSMHIRLRVRYADGRIGHVRFLYLFDERASMWVPAGAINSAFQRGEMAMWCFAF